jgi:hypothetical protein
MGMAPPLPDALSFSALVRPGEFEAHRHWYPKAQHATLHTTLSFFFNLDMERIVNRYCHLHPKVKPEALHGLLQYPCRHFLWAGADLLNVTSAGGRRQMVIIENNSCPSGQKSMPLLEDHQEQGGYRRLVERTFLPYLQRKRLPVSGGLAVLYDKNFMEVSGYAAVIADVFEEPVFFTPCFDAAPDPPYRFNEGVLHVRDVQGLWHPIRAAFRYVTQRPWARIPIHTKTRILNPMLACLAGGRNKLVAAKAYDFFNAELESLGLKINTPETIRDVRKEEIPLWVKKMGGQAVVKIPYSNAGQGVFTIVTERELQQFMERHFLYDRFIVQSLIGNYQWSSTTSSGRLYHVGTIPNAKGKTYVADLRMMVSATENGILPLCVYARRARNPLEDHIQEGSQSWDMLGTNLSIKNPDGTWDSDTNRLMLMDRKDFNKLGIGLDDLIEAYIQTVLSTVAIDKMADTLLNRQSRFRTGLFKSLNDDPSLLHEILL